MGNVSQISEFGKILIFLITGIILVLLMFVLSRFIAPKNPTAEKLTSYECGEEPTGDAWVPFNPRFYIIALIFLLFDVEMVFVFPWATVFGNKTLIQADARWGVLTLIEMFAFLGILILGLVYVWRKGDLEWVKPTYIEPKVKLKPIPDDIYRRVNEQQGSYKVKAFSIETEPVLQAAQPAPVAVPAEGAAPRKTMFKPTFKKSTGDE